MTTSKSYRWRNFKQARQFARSLGLKNQKDWHEYCKSGKKPYDIPQKPSRTYKGKGWKGFGDWLGTGTLAPRDRVYRPFKDARAFVRKLNLKSGREWRQYSSSGKRPDFIPSSPDNLYKDKGWKGWGDFLGTGNVSYTGVFKKDFLSFDDARSFTQSLGFKSRTEWQKYSKSENRLDDIPGHPDQVYKDKGWKGWGDFLGTGNIATFNRKYRSFEEAREFARSLGLKKEKEWREYSKSGKKPDDIPSNPDNPYKGKGWTTWGDFLGTGTLARRDRVYRPFKEARKFVRSLGLKNQKEWKEYYKSGKKPNNIPAAPAEIYKGKGWTTLGDFLGTGNIATFNRKYRSFTEAREFARSLGLKNKKDWQEYSKSGKKPDDIPAAPWRTYSKSNSRRKK